MSQEKIDILERSLKREKAARKSAEKILEDKSRDLYILSDELRATNSKLENLLHEKSSQLKGVFENIIDAFVVIDLWGNVIKFNDAATLLFGYNIDIEALNILSLIYVEDMEYAKTSFTDLQIKGFFKNYKARVYTKLNGVKWVHINASIIYDKDKNPIAAQGIVRDITKERTSNEKLIESENRLSTLVLNLNSGIILEDENRKIVLSNTKFCELLDKNMHPDDLFGLDITLLSEQNKNLVKNPELFVKGLHEIVENKVAVFGVQLEIKDGKVMEINYTPIILDGKSKGFLWTFTDITLEKKYNLSLEAQKLKFSNIIANMNLGLVEVNNDDEILLINQSFSDMSGYSEEELLGKKANRII